jgi:hypothetical protein
MAEHGAAPLRHAVHLALLYLVSLQLADLRQHLRDHDDALTTDADD